MNNSLCGISALCNALNCFAEIDGDRMLAKLYSNIDNRFKGIISLTQHIIHLC